MSACSCDGRDWETTFVVRQHSEMCLCCGALIGDGRPLPHDHVNRFGDGTIPEDALPRTW